MSATPPDEPWNNPPPPPGGYPPPPGGYQHPGYQQPGYPPPPQPGYPPPPPPGYPPQGGYQPQYGGYQPYPQASPYTGWWQRVGATFLDGLLVGIPLEIILAIAGVTGYGLSFIVSLGHAVYQALMLSASGRTIGNRAVRTYVVDADTGAPVVASKAWIRAVVQLVLNVTVIGGILDILWPLWDQRNQTLHDKAAGTVVLKGA